MALTESEKIALLVGRQPLKENTPVPPKEKDNSSEQIARKKEELELKKLEIEIKKLEAPSTSMDYFKEMLALQQTHFTQLLTMNNKQAELERSILELKMGEGGDVAEDLIYSLIPLLPELMKKKTQLETPTQQKSEEVNQMAKPKIPTAEEVLEFKRKIKSGELSEESAFAEAIKAYPQITKEQVHQEYEKIKNS